MLVTSQTSSRGHISWTYTQLHTCFCVLSHTRMRAYPMYSQTCLVANSLPSPHLCTPLPGLHTHRPCLCVQLLKQNQGLLMRLLSGTLEATLTLPYPINAEWTVSINWPQGTRGSQRRQMGPLSLPSKIESGSLLVTEGTTLWTSWLYSMHFSPNPVLTREGYAK